MVPSDGLASCGINRRVDAIAGLQPIGPYLDAMPDRLALRLNVDDAGLRPVPAEPAGVGGLPTAFGIEGRLLEKHIRLLRLTRDREDVADRAVRFQMVVANEAARPSRQRGGETAGRDPAPLTLGLHQRRHGFEVHFDASLLRQFSRELDRKAKRVMQVEHFSGVKGSALEQWLQALRPLTQGDAEALLF